MALSLQLKDASNTERNIAAFADANNNLATGSVPLIGGLPVAENNRVPVGLPAGLATVAAQTAANSALGAPEDAAWGGTGGGSLTALGKGVFGLLKGVLRTTLELGGTAISSANRLPVALPAGFATETGQTTSNTTLGAPADAAWNNGSGSAIALLKAVVTALRGTIVVQGGTAATTAYLRDIGTSSGVVLAQNTARRFLLIRNQGTVDAWLTFGAGAVVSQGMLLEAGQTLILDGLMLPSAAINAITASGSTKLYTLEG